MTIRNERTEVPRASILPLSAIGDSRIGGKAEGLARLIAMGLSVPRGFVVVDARPGVLPPDLGEQYRRIGAGPVAVRSSALGEDSSGASFAGQYATLLGVDGEEALVRAVDECLASLASERARAYQQHMTTAAAAASAANPDDRAPHMGVVVQRMVDARAAGVLFTADPVTGRRAHIVLDVVRGLGEALVSGHAAPDHYVMSRGGETLALTRAGPESTDEIVSAAERRALVASALAAEARFGTELDLEWAIDREGELHWLQARPITNLGADPTELDTPLAADHVYTRCNVGEMFPGVCTPLSFSFTARSIDVGMQRMQHAIGIAHEIASECRFIAMFHGHLFLDLSTMAETPRALGSGSAQLALSICGRPIEELEREAVSPVPLVARVANGARYVRYLLGQRSARARLRNLRRILTAVNARECAADPQPSARAQWEAIGARLSAIYDAMDYHLISSAGSGVLSTTLLSVLARGAAPSDADHARAAALLAGAGGVESADIVAGAEAVQRAIAGQANADARFATASVEDAREWLEGWDSGDAGALYRAYLERHGHRAVKELELRQPEWREDPTPLLKSLQAGVRRLELGTAEWTRTPRAAMSEGGLLLRGLALLARQAIRSREETKSGLVDVTTHFKCAYRRLSRALVCEALLPDTDAIWFLTHAELGELALRGGPEFALRAIARRKLLPQLETLEFPDVFVGAAVPIREAPAPVSLARDATGDAARVVTGAPVSRGRVRGRARVVFALADAEALLPGEILITRVTDVGFAPYFSLIAGLVTDIGSAVSHGAVVAREYGLPAVVNTRVATRVFRTGDLVELDGEQGRVCLAREGDPADRT